MKHNITTVAFDADDTLWANEDLFVAAQTRYTALLAPYRHDWDAQELHATEQRNLAYFGYGIKGFTLSMIETAIQISDGAVTGHEIAQIIDLAREMVHAPLILLPQVATLIPQLAQSYRLMLITKGDLFDQEAKIARSGLADYFRHIEVVSEKNSSTYANILRRHDINPSEFVMIGNSLRSDILPVVALGAHAIHVPYHLTWQHEHVDVPADQRTWHEMSDITTVANWLAQNH
jgi:putative hydrolase of the HAD superfamily